MSRPRKAFPARTFLPPTPIPVRPYNPYGWPEVLPAGERSVGALEPCAGACGRQSWVRYGTTVLCLVCAKRHALLERCRLEGTAPPAESGPRPTDDEGASSAIDGAEW